MLVVPGSLTPTLSKVSLKELDPREAGESLMIKNNSVIDDIVGQILKIQQLVSKKKYKDAYQTSNELSQKYPNVPYLNYLKASCLVVLNKRKLAIQVLEETLLKFPENNEAMTLYSSLVPKAKQKSFLNIKKKGDKK